MTAIDTTRLPVRAKSAWTKPRLARIDGRAAENGPTPVNSDSAFFSTS